MKYETLVVEKAQGVAMVTLNRPEKRNAMSTLMLQELGRLFSELREDPDTRFVIFIGAGKAFSSGADLSDLATAMESPHPAHVRGRLAQLSGHDFMRGLENLEQVTIAAINGPALGAGLSLAMACDFRIASEDSSFGIPEANVGVFFTWGCTPRLVSLIGPAKAKELIMTCEVIDAREALSIGLVNRVVQQDRLLEVARELASEIASKAPLAIRMAKKTVNAASAPGFGDLFICEPELVERLYLSRDPMEGITAFREKRTPRFTGE